MIALGKPDKKTIGNIRQTHATKNGLWFAYEWKVPIFPSYQYFSGNILSVSDYNYIEDIETNYLSCQWHCKDNTKTLALINNGYYFPTEDNTTWKYIFKNAEKEINESISCNVNATAVSYPLTNITKEYDIALEWYNSEEKIPTYMGNWTIESLKIKDLNQSIDKTYESGTILSCSVNNSCKWFITNSNRVTQTVESFSLEREFDSNVYSLNYISSYNGFPRKEKKLTLKTNITETKIKDIDITLNKGYSQMISLKASWSL